MKKIIVCTLVANICWTASSYAAEKSGILSLIIPVLASAATKNQPFKGIFIDSEIGNASYLTSSGRKGRAGADGGCFYDKGDIIEFYIGNKKLGSVDAGAITTVFDFEYPDQVALLLQSIDEDGNPGNGIQISESDYQKISSASFNISEIDPSNIAFQEKIRSTMGYPLPYIADETNQHALDSVKKELLDWYDVDFLRYQYETIELNNGVLGVGPDGKTVFGLNPNYSLKSPESRLRLYFYWNYAHEFLSQEQYLYATSVKDRNKTTEIIKEKSRKIVGIFTDVTGLIGLSKSTKENIGKLKEAKRNIPFGGISGAMSPNQLNIFDSAYKQTIYDVAMDTLGEGILDEAVGAIFESNLLFKDKETLKSVVDSCMPIPPPSKIIDIMECLETTVGEATLALNDIGASIYNIADIRKDNAALVANDYLQLFYLLDRRFDQLGGIFCNISSLPCGTFDEATQLETALDSIASLRNIKSYEYNFDTAKLLIQKYKKTVDTLMDNFLTDFNTDLLRSLEPEHLKTQLRLEPTSQDNQYIACLDMKNLYFPLKMFLLKLSFLPTTVKQNSTVNILS